MSIFIIVDYLDYWMSCIYSTVRQQDRVRDKKTPRQPAIVIVCTHKDVSYIKHRVGVRLDKYVRPFFCVWLHTFQVKLR